MAHELSSTTLKILSILNDCHFHSGSDIAEHLCISRSAVWKVIQRLKKYNIDIKSEHHGYLLTTPLILLDKHKIKSLIKDPKIDVECFETISSTTDYLRDQTPLKNLHVCLTEHQSKGRGRMGRLWASPFGRNVYFSIIYIFNKDISDLSGLSLAVGVLTANALSSLNENIKPLLKWPNDLYVNNQKVGGILIDLLAEANGNCTATISVGLNVNMKDVVLEGIDQPWTSLEHIVGVQLDRNILIAQLINSIVTGMIVFAEKSIDPFLEEWKRYDFLANKEISLRSGEKNVAGIAKGITSQGHLCLQLSSGEVKSFSSGDTTVLTATQG